MKMWRCHSTAHVFTVCSALAFYIRHYAVDNKSKMAASGEGQISHGSSKLKAFSNRIEKSEETDKMIPQIRNIGIAAHIDAGKTTTTERMLFYAGVTKKVGDVDSGTTTTDYMEQEMERGITIQSAAVYLNWKDHPINLIDTPGHVDFSIEVERSLCVVDGVIALFDAAVGVEAQSFSVLSRAKRFKNPVIAFINKMDKGNANFYKSVESLREKLGVLPVPIDIPLLSDTGEFEGTIDLVQRKTVRYGGRSGEKLVERNIAEEDPYIREICNTKRTELISIITSRDDTLAEAVIEALDKNGGDQQAAEDNIDTSIIRAAIRNCTLNQNQNGKQEDMALVPVLCGASRRDIGVQPLLDAVNYYLPSPLDRHKILRGYSEFGDEVSLPIPSNSPKTPVIALAFKVVHSSKGNISIGNGTEPLVFFRVYCGRVTKGMSLANRSNRNKTEVIQNIYVLHGGHHSEVPFLAAGMIGAAFLKSTVTGDTLVTPSYGSRLHLPDEGPHVTSGSQNEDPVFTLEGIKVSSPVLSYAIEPPTNWSIKPLEGALTCLKREDPSIRVSRNEKAQIVISGMGELHLEIIMSRLEREYNLKCRLLRAMIEYKEVITSKCTLKKQVITSDGLPLFEIDIDILPLMEDESCKDDDNVILVVPDSVKSELLKVKVSDEESNSRHSHNDTEKENRQRELKEHISVINQGLSEACKMGPYIRAQMHGFSVCITRMERRGVQPEDPSLLGATRQLFNEIFREKFGFHSDGTEGKYRKYVGLLEPMIEVEVTLSDNKYFGDVMTLISGKNAIHTDVQDDQRKIIAVIPIRNCAKINGEITTATKGHGYYSSRLHHYRLITQQDVLSKILSNRGFDSHHVVRE
eukprot:Tbor_TRINITY_DN2026_c0_g1::TRINITY_DN2026_c0_g1_i1::g.12154::m.12154/K02355/fusA, GFM, EFG; elongation factor G